MRQPTYDNSCGPDFPKLLDQLSQIEVCTVVASPLGRDFLLVGLRNDSVQPILAQVGQGVPVRVHGGGKNSMHPNVWVPVI